ncbi:hypothetical protein QZH41_020727, partial [Actinostola sp. cb2023]
KIEELGTILNVDISSYLEKSRRFKLKKVREGFETMVDEHVEEGDLKVFLEIVWRIVSDESSSVLEGEVVQVEENQSPSQVEPSNAPPQAGKEIEETTNKVPTPMGSGVVSELLKLRREFRISGSIGGENQKDRLSFVGLMRQIDSGLAKGYEETDIVDAVIRAISSTSKLMTYLEIMDRIGLQKLRQVIRVHYREKSSTELYQELTTLIQDPKESPQDFLLRALSLRERVIFASKADDALSYPDWTKPFVLFTNASKDGLGAALYQEQDKQLRPVGYASRTLTPAERNYHLHSGKLEFLALKWSVCEHFRDYLFYAPHFTVYTDNNPLTYVQTTAKLNATGHHWVAELADFDFTIKYHPGSLNTVADTLSRMPMEINQLNERYNNTTSQDEIDATLAGVTALDLGEATWISSINENADIGDKPSMKDTDGQRVTTMGLKRAQQADPTTYRVLTLKRGGQRPSPRMLRNETRPTRTLLGEWNKLEIGDDGLLR